MKCSCAIAMRIMSVCPSVRLSVKRVHCDKTQGRSVQIFIPLHVGRFYCAPFRIPFSPSIIHFKSKVFLFFTLIFITSHFHTLETHFHTFPVISNHFESLPFVFQSHHVISIYSSTTLHYLLVSVHLSVSAALFLQYLVLFSSSIFIINFYKQARYRRQSALQKYNSEKRASNIALSYGVDVDK